MEKLTENLIINNFKFLIGNIIHKVVFCCFYKKKLNKIKNLILKIYMFISYMKICK